MGRAYVTPGGVRLCRVTKPPAPEAMAAVDELAAAVIAADEARRAALTPEQLAAEDAHRAEGRARLARLQARARE
jgi:hypothetical protein